MTTRTEDTETPIRIKLVPGGREPVRATIGSAAYDLFARAVRFNTETRTLECDLGVRVEIPEGWCGLLLPRSSVLRHGLMMANSMGLIDSDYRGELRATFRVVSDGSMVTWYEEGDRCAQLMFIPVPATRLEVVDRLSDTARGEGGHGSTGTR